MVSALVSWTEPPVLLSARPASVSPPVRLSVCVPAPVNTTRCALGLKVPELLQLPPTWRSPPPAFKPNVPLVIVRLPRTEWTPVGRDTVPAPAWIVTTGGTPGPEAPVLHSPPAVSPVKYWSEAPAP